MLHGSHSPAPKAVTVPAEILVYTVNNLSEKSWTSSSCNRLWSLTVAIVIKKSYIKLNTVFFWISHHLTRDICVAPACAEIENTICEVTSSLSAVTVVTVIPAI